MRWTTMAIVAAALLSAAAGTSWSQNASINFDVATGDWNVDTNWVTAEGFNIIPGDNFPDEVAGISNGGTANLTVPAMHDVFGLVIGETHDPTIPNSTEEDGTLNVSGGGQLRLVDPDGLGGAALRIGDAGRGVLNLSGGSVSADILSIGGAADSALNISGSAVLGISAAANLGGGITRIEGPNVVFDVEGNVSLGGTFTPVITGTTHSAITSAGTANMGGTLRVEFNGHVPSLGESWTLINASSVSGTFDNIDVSAADALPRGATFAVSYDVAGSGDVDLSLRNQLILNVHRRTGAVSIENAIGDPIEMDGYRILSPSGLLDSGDAGWQSLQDQTVGNWEEANPGLNQLSELNADSSRSIAAGAPLGLGNPYSFAPAMIGTSGDELTFEYSTPSGEVITGFVEYSGPRNNFVLSVDPATGSATLKNESAITADVDGYAIQSASGSLLAGTWNSLADLGIGDWQEANPTATSLAELNPLGSSIFTEGTSFDMGTLFDTAGTNDLTLEFLLVTGEVIQGIVEYEAATVDECIVGDTTPCDLVVDINDLNAVRNNFGTGDGSDPSGIPSDAFPFDGLVDINDLNGVRNNFGNVGPAAVPEPSTIVLSLLAVAGLVWTRRSR